MPDSTPSTSPGDDDLTAALELIRKHWAARKRISLGFDPVDGVALVAAVEAALKLADDWKQEFAKLEPSGADAVRDANPGSYLVSGRLGALEDCEQALREAIRAALTGQESSDGT